MIYVDVVLVWNLLECFKSDLVVGPSYESSSVSPFLNHLHSRWMTASPNNRNSRRLNRLPHSGPVFQWRSLRPHFYTLISSPTVAMAAQMSFAPSFSNAWIKLVQVSKFPRSPRPSMSSVQRRLPACPGSSNRCNVASERSSMTQKKKHPNASNP